MCQRDECMLSSATEVLELKQFDLVIRSALHLRGDWSRGSEGLDYRMRLMSAYAVKRGTLSWTDESRGGRGLTRKGDR